MTDLEALRGRHRECAKLDGLLGEVRTGQSAVLVLRGEAGIGKTALLRYLTDAASGFTVTRCAGVESEMELPFAGLHELCSPILDGLESLPEPQQRALSGALGLEAGGSPDKFLVALGARGLIGAACERGPLLCIVEDAHWLDNASAQVLGFIGRRLKGEPVGLVFAARAPIATPDHLMGLPELRVDGLDERTVRALLRSVGGMRIDETIRARVLDETSGNPLAVLELGARMMTAGFAGGFAMVEGPSLSERIEDEYRARLDALPYDTQQLALLAAADPVGDTTLIQRAAVHLGLGVDAADAAVDGDLLSVGASVRFRHPLLRSAVYRGATGQQRRAAPQAPRGGERPRVGRGSARVAPPLRGHRPRRTGGRRADRFGRPRAGSGWPCRQRRVLGPRGHPYPRRRRSLVPGTDGRASHVRRGRSRGHRPPVDPGRSWLARPLRAGDRRIVARPSGFHPAAW